MGDLGGKMERLTEYTKLGSLIQKGNISTRQMIDKLGAYEDVGTIEEFKTLKEKNEPKKANSFSGCIHNNVERDWDFAK